MIMKYSQRSHSGWTLIELVMVIAIIGILSAIAIRTLTGTLENARFNSTAKEMNEIVFGIVGNPDLITTFGRTDYGYVGDTGELPSNLDALFTDNGVCGWDGPYVTVDFEENPDDYKLDGWGKPYTFGINASNILQVISDSAGTKTIDDTTDLLHNTVQVQLYNSDGVPLDNLSGDINVQYGCGGPLADGWHPLSFNESTGKFVLNTVPIGQRLVRGTASGDTTYKTLGVVPGSNSSLEMTVYPTFGTISSDGCGVPGGAGDYIVSETIINNGTPTFLVDKIALTFEDGPCWACDNAYLEKIMVGPLTYWDYSTVGTRVGSGTQVILSQVLYIYAGTTTLDLYFSTSPTGGSSPINMTGTTMSMKFYPTNAPSQQISYEVCGSVCTDPALSLGGTPTVSGTSRNIVTVPVYNGGAAPLDFDVINILNMVWWDNLANNPCWECGIAYLSTVESGGQQYWSYTNEGSGTRASSGSNLLLRSPLILPGLSTTSIEFTFNNQTQGTGAAINMSNVDFAVPLNSSCVDFGTQAINFTATGNAVECDVCLTQYSGYVLSGTPQPDQIELQLINGGVPCIVTSMIVTTDTTAYLTRIRDNNQDKWTGPAKATNPGTTTILDYPITLTDLDATIDMIMFSTPAGASIDMHDTEVTIGLGIDCCNCTSPQNHFFVILP